MIALWMAGAAVAGTAGSALAQGAWAGRWNGSMQREGKTVDLAFEIASREGGLRGFLVSRTPERRVLVLPRAPHNFVLAPGLGEPFDWPRLAPGLADLLSAWALQRTRD